MSEKDAQSNAKWGLLNIFQNHKSTIKIPDFLLNITKPRMVEVKKLFDDENIQFQNDNVRKEINNIKITTKKDIKRFKSPRARRR